MNKMRFQTAIVAGGRGQRMRPVSDTPKAMLPIGGKPILEHQLLWLKKSGFEEVFLCLGHGAEIVRGYFGDGSRWGVRLEYSVETVSRGTAGAVADLGGAVKEDLLVVYGDLFIELDCGALLDFHRGHAAAATIVVRKTDHPEDSDLVEAEPNGRVRKIGRMAQGAVSGELGCAAVWALRPELLKRVPRDDPSDFARDIFPRALAGGEALMAYRTEERVIDVGTPKRYDAFVKRFAG